jgi:hypothetical protein
MIWSALAQGFGMGVGAILAHWALTSLRDFVMGIFDKQEPDYEQIASAHVRDLTSARLPPEDVASNIAEDLRRAAKETR